MVAPSISDAVRNMFGAVFRAMFGAGVSGPWGYRTKREGATLVIDAPSDVRGCGWKCKRGLDGSIYEKQSPNPQQIATKGFSVVFNPTGYTDQQKESLPKSDIRKWVKTESFSRWPPPSIEITKGAITSSIIDIETPLLVPVIGFKGSAIHWCQRNSDLISIEPEIWNFRPEINELSVYNQTYVRQSPIICQILTKEFWVLSCQ